MKRLILIFLILFIPFAFSETVTYGENWEKTDLGNNHFNLKIGVSNLQDDANNWKPFTDVVKVNYHDYLLRFSFNQYWLDVSPYVIYNNNKYSLEWIINHFGNIREHFDVNDNRDFYKWALTIKGIPTNLKNNTQFLGFDYVDSNNLVLSDFQIDKNRFLIIIKNKIVLSYYDLIHHNYCVDINKETVLIGCLDANYNYHGEILNHWVLDENGFYSIILDPLISETVQQSSDDAGDIGSPPVYDDTAISYLFTTNNATNTVMGVRFQTVDIPKDATILDANLVITTFANCGGLGCSARSYGVASDDTSTWSSGNRPKDASLTANYGTFTITASDQYNGFYVIRKIKTLATAINEITSRVNWVSGNDMSFVIQRQSIGIGKSFVIFTYDGGILGYPISQLEVNYCIAPCGVVKKDLGSIHFVNPFKLSLGKQLNMFQSIILLFRSMWFK